MALLAGGRLIPICPAVTDCSAATEVADPRIHPRRDGVLHACDMLVEVLGEG
jgi:hypothetical protein